MPKQALSVLGSYKAIFRRVYRLPLDKGSIFHLLNLIKQEYRASSSRQPTLGVNKKKPRGIVQLLDSILEDERYENISDLLDKIYKKSQPPQWLKDFNDINYTRLKEVWPQVHLIKELTKDTKVLRKYEQALESEKNEDFSVIRHFNLSCKQKGLSLVRVYSQQSDSHSMMQNVTALYNLLSSNQSKISRTKIQPLEVVFPTNRFALPISPHKRDHMLRDKIASVRFVFQSNKPIGKQDLSNLIDVAQGGEQDMSEINPHFYRFMVRKRAFEKEEKNIAARRKLRQKQLIPNDNNIRKWYRAYVIKQFYFDTNEQAYKMSWMQNFYDVKPSD